MGKYFSASARPKAGLQESNETLQKRAAANMMSALWNRGSAHYSPESLLGMVRKQDGSPLLSPAELKRSADPLGAISSYLEHYPDQKLQIITPGAEKPHYLSRGVQDGKPVFEISDETVPAPKAPEEPSIGDYFRGIFSKTARQKISNWNAYKKAQKSYSELSSMGLSSTTKLKNDGFELRNVPAESINEYHADVMSKKPEERSRFEENYCETLSENSLNTLGRYALNAKHRLEKTTIMPYNEYFGKFNTNLDNGPATQLFQIWCFNKAATDPKVADLIGHNQPETLYKNRELRSEFVNAFADAEDKTRMDPEKYAEYYAENLSAQPKVYTSETFEKNREAREQRHERAMTDPQNEIEKMYAEVADKNEHLKRLGDRAMISMNILHDDSKFNGGLQKVGLKGNLGMTGLDEQHGLAYHMGVVAGFRMACHNDSAKQALEKYGVDSYINSICARPEFKRLMEEDTGSVHIDSDVLKNFKKDDGAQLERNVLRGMKNTLEEKAAQKGQEKDLSVAPVVNEPIKERNSLNI